MGTKHGPNVERAADSAHIMWGMETAPMTAADVMTSVEVAELLHMPQTTVEGPARRGVMPSRKIGRRRLFVRSSVR